MSGTDIIHFGGEHYGVRDLHEAWIAAGSPPINSAGRLYAEQKSAWDAYQRGTGSPADNPDQPDRYPLAHVRFAALDITATPERVYWLSAAGLFRPYSYEPWHWQLPNIYNYPLVYSIPSGAGTTSTPFPASEEDEMATLDELRGVIAGELKNWVGYPDAGYSRVQVIDESVADIKSRIRGPKEQPYDQIQAIRGDLAALSDAVKALSDAIAALPKA